MGRIATFAFAATCAALSASAGGAASDGTGSSDPTPELRADMRESCAASTRALAAAAMPAADMAEAPIAGAPGGTDWSLGQPGASHGSVQPARAADMPVPQLVSARSAFIRGPDGAIDEFSLRATFDAIRLLRGCSDL
jgi:hypothetical protein